MSDSQLISIVCTTCATEYSAAQLQGFCTVCGKVLYCVYDTAQVKQLLTKEELAKRSAGIWRWRELLPLREAANAVSLSEGNTPLLPCPRIAEQLGCRSLLLKDEGRNPTGSLRARGMAVATAVAREQGITSISVPSLGDAGDALAAYAARAGLKAYSFIPYKSSVVHLALGVACGANTYRIDRMEMESNQLVRALAQRFGWFDASAMREPYRIEGEKTLGYELAEQYDYKLPDVLVYPLGSVIGLAAIWKGWAELEAIGWLSSKRPRVYAIQSEGCAPLAEAFITGKEQAEIWEQTSTRYPSLLIPRVVGDYIVLKLVRDSGGRILTVNDDDIEKAQLEMGEREGIFVGPEGALAFAGLKYLRATGTIAGGLSIALVNPASGMKEPEVVNLDNMPPVQAGLVVGVWGVDPRS